MLAERYTFEDLERLMPVYRKFAYRVARHYGIEAEAEDIFQDSIINTLKAIDIDNVKNLRSYLGQAVINRALDHVRKSKRRKTNCFSSFENENDDGLYESIKPVSEQPSLEESISWKELTDKVMDYVKEMPETRKLVFYAFYIERLEYHEIAHKYGIEMGTIKSRLHRVRTDIKRAFPEITQLFYGI